MAQHMWLRLVWISLLHNVVSVEHEDEFIPTIHGQCVFPFWYRHEKYHDCVKLNAKHRWCSLHSIFQGYWKYCSLEDFAQCMFPFWYRRTIYWECTEDGEVFGRRWCSLTRNYNMDRVWKFC
uniref:Fibronectin type-II domain-containing protein n=1 Tax=Castor canadensis TaxID=51338 RepID=A0A8C0ZUB7_CASCN